MGKQLARQLAGWDFRGLQGSCLAQEGPPGASVIHLWGGKEMSAPEAVSEHLQGVGCAFQATWASSFTSLSLSLLICELGVLRAPDL